MSRRLRGVHRLKAAYQALTGRVLNVAPSTPPAPGPIPPSITADYADHALWAEISAWAAAKHTRANRDAAAAARAWAAAKGLT